MQSISGVSAPEVSSDAEAGDAEGPSPEILRAAESRHDRGLHGGPVMDDLCIVEAQGLIPSCRRAGIPDQILVATIVTGVVLTPVDLEDEPPAQDEVDATDPVDGHLSSEDDAQQVKPQAEDRFEPALRIVVREVEEPPSGCRQSRADSEPRRVCQSSTLQSGLEGCEERLLALAAEQMEESRLDVDDSEGDGASEEVAAASASVVVIRPSAPADPDVHAICVCEDPHAVMTQRRAAGEGSAVRGGTPEGVGERRRGEQPRTDAVDASCPHSSREGGAIETVPLEARSASEAAETIEGGSWIEHPRSVASPHA